MASQPAYSSSGGGWVARTIPAAQGTRQDPLWMRHPSIAECTHVHLHMHSNWDNADTPVHPTCLSLGCGRKPESQRKSMKT